MEHQKSLFAPEPFSIKHALTSRIAALVEQNIFVGTSSWRYEGWLGQIYTPERYLTRGRFSKKKFHDECIHEYAETFPVVGGDFSFYSVPDRKFWDKLIGTAPKSLQWSLKISQDFTAKRFSQHAGARAGSSNPAFLDAGLFEAAFLEPLAPYLDRVSVLMAEFSTFSKVDYPEPRTFFDDLDTFLSLLPKTIRYGIEMRNEDFLDARYFEVLQRHGVAHVFNSWTRMPSLADQLLIQEAFTAPFTVARALLRPGRSYEQAVEQFSPYAAVKDEYPAGRHAIRDLIQTSLARKRPAYVHANNRFEGNAIGTIAALTADLAL